MVKMNHGIFGFYMPCSSMLVGHITFYDGSTDRHRGRVLKKFWAISSVGRTSLLHSECHQFKSDMCPLKIATLAKMVYAWD